MVVGPAAAGRAAGAPAGRRSPAPARFGRWRRGRSGLAQFAARRRQPPPGPASAAVLPPDADPNYSTPINLDPDVNYKYATQKEVADPTGQAAGTITINTAKRKLYLSLGDGKAMEYGIAVGKAGFAWKGEAVVGRKSYWPGWTPPPEMLERRPELPEHMDGSLSNPLGARALYLFQGNKDTLVPHPRHQRAAVDRQSRVVGLHPHAERRRDRPLRPGLQGCSRRRDVSAPLWLFEIAAARREARRAGGALFSCARNPRAGEMFGFVQNNGCGWGTFCRAPPLVCQQRVFAR